MVHELPKAARSRKNSRTAPPRAWRLIKSCGMTVSMSTALIRSLIARSMRNRPMRNWFSISSPTERTRRFPQDCRCRRFAAPVAQFGERLARSPGFFLAQNTAPYPAASRPSRMFIFTRPTLERLVALGVEEQLAEQGFSRVERRRLAGTHDAVNVDQRLFARVVLVHAPACCGCRRR